MTVLSLEHAEPRVRGYICRHMYELRPGVYTGRLSASRRDAIWKHILKEQPNLDAVMCYEQEHNSVKFISNGQPTRRITEIDGVQLISYTRDMDPHWYKYLAKSVSDSYLGKPLREHLLETGYFAKILLTESAASCTLDILATMADGISKEELLNDICFVTSIHDTGKIHPFFQKKMNQEDDTHSFRHEKYSAKEARKYFKTKGFDRRTSRMLADIIGDHHQNKQDNDQDVYDIENIADLDAEIVEIEDYFATRFPITPFTVKDGCTSAFCTLLSGVLRCSDWASSSFGSELSENEYASEAAYIEAVKEKSRAFIAEGGLNPWQPRTHYDYTDLFSSFKNTSVTLRPLQGKMIEVIGRHPAADLIVIEDQMGAGKTEAGLYAAMNLMASKNKQGLYFALPTGATAEAMLPRLQEMKDTADIFQDTDLKLFTGMAWMKDGSESDVEDRISWTKSGPRKLFSKFACGTVDQIMASAEALKAGDMRILGLCNKVLIIDEFHEYDAFMLRILKKMLKWMKALGVPVIILSATLQKKTLKEICSVYEADLGAQDGYPMITVAENGAATQHECRAATRKVYTSDSIPENEAVSAVLESVKSGGDTLYFANTVNRAIAMYHKLSEAADPDTAVRLYAARMTPKSKELRGAEMKYLFGKDGKKDGKRPQKTVVVATQIMEVSMDVDFDTVFSELAPIDSILQRIGRMRRHDDKGTVRETGFKSIFHLVVPEKNGYWYMPYDTATLNSTQTALEKRTVIAIPDDIRGLVEEVYNSAGEEWKEVRLKEMSLGARAAEYETGNPEDDYCPRNDLRTTSITRYSEYETTPVLLLSDNDISDLQNGRIGSYDKEWSMDAIENHSVSLSNKQIAALEMVDIPNSKMPIYIAGYIVAKDKPEYWEEDGVFST